ncbi:hypothetical protein GC175_25675 [bacterium]|nr:hypothetical protein [bacterium]
MITGSAVDTGDVRSGVAAVAVGFEPTTWDEQSAAHWLDDGLLLHLALDENSTIAAALSRGINAVDAAAERVAPASADLRSADQRSYVSTGRMAQDASCSGATCPEDGVRGALANSLRFNGIDDTLTVPWLAIYNPMANFSVGA